jgi:hypothetical protein
MTAMASAGREKNALAPQTDERVSALNRVMNNLLSGDRRNRS